MSFWLRVKGYGTFWPRAKGYTTFQPGAKGYATFRSKDEGQGEPGRLPSAGLEPEAISVPYPRYPMRPEGPMWGPKGPTMGMGGEGGEGPRPWVPGTLAPPAGAHRTHKLNRNINEEQ